MLTDQTEKLRMSGNTTFWLGNGLGNPILVLQKGNRELVSGHSIFPRIGAPGWANWMYLHACMGDRFFMKIWEGTLMTLQCIVLKFCNISYRQQR